MLLLPLLNVSPRPLVFKCSKGPKVGHTCPHLAEDGTEKPKKRQRKTLKTDVREIGVQAELDKVKWRHMDRALTMPGNL